MQVLFVLSFVIMAIGIALGVGASTIALGNFFAALADGKIDTEERHLMGVAYAILRVAMVVIAAAFLVQLMLGYVGISTPYDDLTVATSFAFLIVLLYGNAILMTYHRMPHNFGPAVQVAGWYVLGIMEALATLHITSFSVLTFLWAFGVMLTASVVVVNLGMHYLVGRV